MVSPIGRTKGTSLRGKGDVVLVAAQLDDADGNPTEQYVLLRADEFGRLRTIAVGGGASTSHAPMMPQVDDLAATNWGIPGWVYVTLGSTAITQHRLGYVPIYVERSRTFTQVGVHVIVAGAGGRVVRLGLYNAVFDADGNLTPDSLIVDAGTVAVDSTGQKSIAISETLAEGFYFMAGSSDGAPDLSQPQATNAIGVPVSSGGSTILTSFSVNLFVDVVDGSAPLTDPATAPTGKIGFSSARMFMGE